MAITPALWLLLRVVERVDRPHPERSVVERRAAGATSPISRLFRRTRTSVSTTEHRVPVPGGSISVPVHRARNAPSRRPVHVYFQGGSFWLGSARQYEPLTAWYAAESGCVVRQRRAP